MALVQFTPVLLKSLTTIFPWLLSASVAYTFCRIIYRLYFHPLAKVPGPKIAAATGLYEFWYDVVLRGKYVFRIKEMHAKYGPIIRICPNEVHIDDSTYWHQLYGQSTRRMQKPAKSAFMVGAIPSSFSSIEPELHRLRRAPLDPLFSRNSVAKLTPDIQKIIDELCGRLRDACKSGQIVNLMYAFSALTIDVINEFCFSSTYKAVLMPDFNKNFHDGMVSYGWTALLGMQIQGIHDNVLNRVPPMITAYFNAAFARVLSEHEKWAKQIEQVRLGNDSNHELSDHETIFHALLNSKLPPHEKTTQRLQGEAVVMINAGTMTTAGYLKILFYFILNDPAILRRLRAELKEAIPNPRIIPPISTLEKLEYFSAVVTEGLRLAYGVSHRLRRVSPDEDMRYTERYIIPKGYTISMSPMLIHENAEIFPDPEVFRPERWLKSNKTSDAERALVPFSTGARNCVGQHLARAEMYLVVASLIRRFDFEMQGVDRNRDIDTHHDCFVPLPAMNTIGLPVKVTACDW